MAKAVIDIEVPESFANKTEAFLSKMGITLGDLLQVAFMNVCKRILKEKEETYTYNPLPANKRKKLEEYITMYFKNKAQFARESGIIASSVTRLLDGSYVGGQIVWKKINDTFEKAGVMLPTDLKIKYKVVDGFGQTNT